MLRSGTIEELKATVSSGRGFARTNLFYVLLPSIEGNRSAYEYGLLCTSVNLPSRQLTTIQRELNTAKQDVVYGYVNANVSMTFRVLNNQRVREYFEAWQRNALSQYDDVEGRWEVSYPDSYCKQITIFQLEKGVSYPIYRKDVDLGAVNLSFDLDAGTNLKSNYQWRLDRAFPVSVTNETLTDGSNNEISTITVDFSYQFWTGEKVIVDGKLENVLAGILGTVAANI